MNISTAQNFDAIYADMLLQFPPEELKPKEDFERFLALDAYGAYEFLDESGQFVGYASLLQGENFIWVDYVAILKQFHSKGFGSKAFGALMEKFSYLTGCYLEVEKPDPKRINTLKRIEFYKRFGAQKLDINYFYPNMQGALPMDLYFVPFKGALPGLEVQKRAVSEVFEVFHSNIPHSKDLLRKM